MMKHWHWKIQPFPTQNRISLVTTNIFNCFHALFLQNFDLIGWAQTSIKYQIFIFDKLSFTLFIDNHFRFGCWIDLQSLFVPVKCNEKISRFFLISIILDMHILQNLIMIIKTVLQIIIRWTYKQFMIFLCFTRISKENQYIWIIVLQHLHTPCRISFLCNDWNAKMNIHERNW